MIRETLVASLLIVYVTATTTCSLADRCEIKAESIRLVHNELFQSKAVGSVDFLGGMINLIFNTNQNLIRILQDRKKNITYEQSLTTGSCVKYNGVSNYMQQSYKDAKVLDAMYIGKPGHSIKATTYQIGSFLGGEANYTLSDDCVPIYLTQAYVKEKSTDFLLSIVYYDFTLGIRNSSVFDIPKTCKSVEKVGEAVPFYL